jgi:hypothetical protein
MTFGLSSANCRPRAENEQTEGDRQTTMRASGGHNFGRIENK